MSTSTLLLYAKATGQVLAALTQVAATSTQKPDPFAGAFLPVRYIGDPTAGGYATAQVFVPTTELDIFSDDAQKVQIALARQWTVSTDASGKKQLTSLGASTLITSVAPNVTSGSGGTVSVMLPSTVTAACWARIQPAVSTAASPDPAQFGAAAQTITVPPPTTAASTITIPVAAGLPSGDYWMLVMVTGFQPRLEKFSVS